VGTLGFAGLAREKGLLPGVGPQLRTRGRDPGSWDQVVESWRTETRELGRAFMASEAGVDPKEKLATCERCDLQPLCRVHERIGTLDEGDEEGTE
jgi:ATP-dependent helicase/nuclease subunit B